MKHNVTKYPPLFTSAEDWRNNACLNYSHNPLELYTLGYKKAADHLTQLIIGGSSEQDFLIYPIVFLYRHYIELRLKEIISEGRALLGTGDEFPQTHGLQKLWPVAKYTFQNLFQEKTPLDFKFIEHVVFEFQSVDPVSSSFRYPANKAGQNPTKDISYINVRHLAEIMDRVAEILDAVSSNVSAYKDLKNEFGHQT